MSASRISRAGLELIAGFEGFVDHPYNDAVGFATIGYGHLIGRRRATTADWTHYKAPISHDEGLALLRSDCAIAEAAVRGDVKVGLTQDEFDALVSFTFNVGVGAFAGSTLVKRLNAGARRNAADELLKWDKAGGKVLAGLLHRRQAERALFLGGGHPPAPKPAHTDSLWYMTPRERDAVHRFDHAHGRAPAALVDELVAMRKAVWRAAQGGGGWGKAHRAARYRTLKARTT